MWHFKTGLVVSTLVLGEWLESMIIEVFSNLNHSIILYLRMLGFIKVHFSMRIRTFSDDAETVKSSIKDLLGVCLPILLPSLNL